MSLKFCEKSIIKKSDLREQLDAKYPDPPTPPSKSVSFQKVVCRYMKAAQGNVNTMNRIKTIN